MLLRVLNASVLQSRQKDQNKFKDFAYQSCYLYEDAQDISTYFRSALVCT